LKTSREVIMYRAKFSFSVLFLLFVVQRLTFADSGPQLQGTWRLVSYDVEIQTTGQESP
jgi:hypothetical protein